MEDFKKLVQICRGRRVYIQTHNFPDPDAIGSAFGLQRLLEEFEIAATICYAGRIDKISTVKMVEAFGIELFSYEQLKAQMTENDAIICVDSQKNNGNITDFIGDEIACIDHHPTFVPVEYEYKEIRITGACASLIAAYYQEMGILPDHDVATALMHGIRMDTLQFSRGVTQLDLEMLAYLFPLCDRDKLSRLERNNMELQDLRAYGAAIDSIKIYGNAGFATIPFACPDGLIAALSDFILALEEVTVSFVQCFREDGIKISARSEVPEAHAGNLLHEALLGIGDGGGHQEMAGGLVKKEALESIGAYPDQVIMERFLKCLSEEM